MTPSHAIDISPDLTVSLKDDGTLYVSSTVKLTRRALSDRIKRVIRARCQAHGDQMARLQIASQAALARRLTGDVR